MCRKYKIRADFYEEKKNLEWQIVILQLLQKDKDLSIP